MLTVQGQPPPVHLEPPEDPPAEGGPTEADRRFWASQNDTWDDVRDDEPPDSHWDEQAELSRFLDLHEFGVKVV